MTLVDRSRLPEVVRTRSLTFPMMMRRELESGLELRLVSHRAAPVVSAVLLLPGGIASDPGHRPGLAAFAADLLDEGSAGRSAIEVSDLLARCGADLDVDVGHDAVVMSLTTLARYLEPALQLLAEMVSAPNHAPADVERVRKLRRERLMQLRDHAPAVAERAFSRALYRSHPYGHLGLGTEAALTSTTIDEIRLYHHAAFVPRGSTLVIAGDLDPDHMAAAAANAFAAWSTPAVPPIDRDAGQQAAPPAPEHPLVVINRAGAQQSELRIGHVCASRSTPDYFALLLLNMVLGGQFVSRVNMNLRQDKGYTYGVRTGFELRRGMGPFVLQTSVGTDVTAPAIREALRELSDVRVDRPVTEHELATAKVAVTQGYPRGFETAQQVARSVASLALHGLPDTYFDEFVDRVEAVTQADVARVAAEYLDMRRMLTLVVGDSDKIVPSLAALGVGEPVIQEPV